MSFIIPNQKLLVIETNNLQFGSSLDPISVTLNLDQSVVSNSPTVEISAPDAAPFTIIAYNTNTSNPEIVFTLTSPIEDFILGHNYVMTLTANGQTDTFNVYFLKLLIQQIGLMLILKIILVVIFLLIKLLLVLRLFLHQLIQFLDQC